MDFYEACPDYRDKFQILAFHDETAKTFAVLDEKLIPVKKNLWQGKDLPFPILLDSTEKTLKTFGIDAFPTTLLIDPDGKLVGTGGRELLEAKLSLPMPRRIQLALNRNIDISFQDPPLQQAIADLAKESKIPIRLDTERLKQAGVPSNVKVPLQMDGLISLRSALHLLLEAFGLVAIAEDTGLVVTVRNGGQEDSGQLSKIQQAKLIRIEAALDRKVTFDFKGKSFAQVADFFQGLTGESFILDPSARKAGLFKSGGIVTGSAKDVPLRAALASLLSPLQMTFVARDELVVLTVASPTKPAD